MHNPAPVLEIDTHKLLWDFDIHTDHQISARKTRPNNNQQQKREFTKFWPQNKTEKNVKRRLSISTLQENWKKISNMKVTIIPILIGAFGTVTKGLLKGLEDSEVGSRVEDHPNDSIIENGQNTEKSPGDLRRLAVTSNSRERPSAKRWCEKL